jgi:hypothetical protein
MATEEQASPRGDFVSFFLTPQTTMFWEKMKKDRSLSDAQTAELLVHS